MSCPSHTSKSTAVNLKVNGIIPVNKINTQRWGYALLSQKAHQEPFQFTK